MEAISIKIHNFRTIADTEITLSSYFLLVGANNAGKSNVIDAIRAFYEKDLKWDKARDFPKFEVTDEESWIEIQYRPSITELATLKDDYKLSDGTFRVRKYFTSPHKDDEEKPKNGIYAYVGGKLSSSRFYGVKNVQQAKLGEIIYIPAVSKLDEQTKLTGPSALRDLVTTVLKKVMGSSPSYGILREAFEKFGLDLKSESSNDGQSLSSLEAEITSEIDSWGTSFELFINPVETDDLVKSLIGHRLQDQLLGQAQDSKAYGQGFQRHLIATLIRLAARYNIGANATSKKEFAPRLTWLLFEEPEAFLHPNQVASLDANLRQLSSEDGSQVLITTHSPQFVSRNINDLCSLARLCRHNASSIVMQISTSRLQEIISVNQQDYTTWQDNKELKGKIHQDDMITDMESIKYALWLNPLRCNAFFTDIVLLVEGPTETALFDYLLRSGYVNGKIHQVAIVDTVGKFNLHRFMNLFGELGIKHGVLFDDDNGKYSQVTTTIESSRNSYTLGIDIFPEDLEAYLGIKRTADHRKPQHVMLNVIQGKIDQENLKNLGVKIQRVLNLS